MVEWASVGSASGAVHGHSVGVQARAKLSDVEREFHVLDSPMRNSPEVILMDERAFLRLAPSRP